MGYRLFRLTGLARIALLAPLLLGLTSCDEFFGEPTEDPVEAACQNLTDIHPEWDKRRRALEFERCKRIGIEAFEQSFKPYNPLARSKAEERRDRDAVAVCQTAISDGANSAQFLGDPKISNLDIKTFVKGRVMLGMTGRAPAAHKYICTVAANTLIEFQTLPEKR